MKLDQFEAALTELEKLASEIPKESSIYILMGRIHKKLGKISEAHKYYNSSLTFLKMLPIGTLI